ncbi:hypothetical protein VB776_09705 [Arcicella sp. DC2W]|uniref:Uncharacterized protein n=1 Tax=Arcicella gelida TaxID=2984195 RepID=A0ABU5S4P0_9BACT|nr:hypothetical protein [Arcicella sp. DC2W]MEA5403188.1 hypothetical protein [Arcicella sp. DC2W]
MSKTSEISWTNSNQLEDTSKVYQDYRKIQNSRQSILNFRKKLKETIIINDFVYIQPSFIISDFPIWNYEKISPFQKLSKDEKIKTYITNKDDVWLLDAFFDINVSFDELDDKFIENLFLNADFQFYLNEEENYLFICNSELLEYDFGKLKVISPLNALRKYGLRKLEQAKEKVYVKV